MSSAIVSARNHYKFAHGQIRWGSLPFKLPGLVSLKVGPKLDIMYKIVQIALRALPMLEMKSWLNNLMDWSR